MLLVAQRVIGSGGDGYNAYCHLHGPATPWRWELPKGVPDYKPGQQATSLLNVLGPGRIRSFLDLACPDGDAVTDVVDWAHDSIVGLVNAGSRLPLFVASGPWYARFEVERGLVGEWHDELHRLRDCAVALSQRTIWVTTGQVVQNPGNYRFVCFESGIPDSTRRDEQVELSQGTRAPHPRGAAENAVWVRESPL